MFRFLFKRWEVSRPVKVGLVATAGSVALYFNARHSVETPVSGRRKVIFLSPKTERALGERQWLEFKTMLAPASFLGMDDPRVQAVVRVTARLLEANAQYLNLPGQLAAPRLWEVAVLDTHDPPNAFCVPNGAICVYTSMLDKVVATGDPRMSRQEYDERLAAVVAHEMAHVICRHGAEKLSKSLFFLPIQILVSALSGSPLILSGILTTVGYELPFSRKLEHEADIVGARLMANACFNPEAMVPVFQQLYMYSAAPDQLQRRLEEEAREGRFQWVPITDPGRPEELDPVRLRLPGATSQSPVMAGDRATDEAAALAALAAQLERQEEPAWSLGPRPGQLWHDWNPYHGPVELQRLRQDWLGEDPFAEADDEDELAFRRLRAQLQKQHAADHPESQRAEAAAQAFGRERSSPQKQLPGDSGGGGQQRPHRIPEIAGVGGGIGSAPSGQPGGPSREEELLEGLARATAAGKIGEALERFRGFLELQERVEEQQRLEAEHPELHGIVQLPPTGTTDLRQLEDQGARERGELDARQRAVLARQRADALRQDPRSLPGPDPEDEEETAGRGGRFRFRCPVGSRRSQEGDPGLVSGPFPLQETAPPPSLQHLEPEHQHVNPEGLSLEEEMEAVEGEPLLVIELPDWLSTHPNLHHRLRVLRKHLPAAVEIYKQKCVPRRLGGIDSFL